MRSLTVVMNPRRIPECIAGFESLTTDVAWVTGYAVIELPPIINGLIADTDYDAYTICADDCIVSQDALDAVLALTEAGAPAATGWCRLDRTHPLVNLTRTPLRGAAPSESSYDFYTAEEVEGWPEPSLPTGFMGMALTTMPRQMWERFPFACFSHRGQGWATDFNLSARLRDAEVPMVAAREGFIDHVKEKWLRGDQAPEKRILVGQIAPSVHIDVKATA